MFRYVVFFLITLLTADGALAQTAPSALTTAGGPPVAAPKKEKGGLLKKVARQVGLPPAIVNNPFSTTAYGLPKKDSAGSALSAMMGTDLADLGLKIKALRGKKGDKKGRRKASKTDYEGLPMVRQFIKIGSGDRTIVEEFHVLKNWQDPSPYVRETFGFSPKEGRIKPLTKDQEGVYLLHGPYKRFQNGELVEEGYYYTGAKDGRWEKYDGKFMLIDKTRFSRGFPAEAHLAYYDSAHTKLREVMPYEYGHLKGTYLAYHPNGQLAEEGKYDNGVKVGRWTEYYPNGTRRFRRKVTLFARDRWDAAAEPTVLQEWDEKGKLTYERPKEKAASDDEEGQ